MPAKLLGSYQILKTLRHNCDLSFGPFNIKDFAGLKNFTSVLSDPGMNAKKQAQRESTAKKSLFHVPNLSVL